MKEPQSRQHTSAKAGLPPGTLIHVGKKKVDHIRISVIRYNAKEFESKEDCSIEELKAALAKEGLKWINVDGVHDVEKVGAVGEALNLPAMLMENIVNTFQRPKLEAVDAWLYLNIKMVGLGPKKKALVAEQVGLVLMHNCLISFQERRGDLFDQLRARLQDNKAHLRAAGVDYLFYRLMDTIVDNYFFVTEHLSSRMEQLEEKVLQQVDQQTLAEIQQLKKLIMRFKRLAVPLREPSMILYKEDLVHIKKSTRPFLRDVYEHVMQVQESVEIQREAIGGLMELYHSGVSQRTNQIMQVLTIISTIFIPLTFIAGIYGMNFKNMPELSWPFGYAAVWGLMLVITVFMLIIFRRKKWL